MKTTKEEIEESKAALRAKAIEDMGKLDMDFLPETTKRLIQTAWMMGYMKSKMEASEL